MKLEHRDRRLLLCISLACGLFLALSQGCYLLEHRSLSLPLLVLTLLLWAVIIFLINGKIKEDTRQLRDAQKTIESFLAGEQNLRLPAEAEGEIYKLFHSVNILATTLDTLYSSEQDAKVFLKDTIADISHQLKTPLAALSIYHSLLQEERENPEAVAEFCTKAQGEVQRIEDLIQNLLKVMRLDTGQVVMTAEPVALSPLIAAVAERFAVMAEASQITLTTAGPEDLTITGDETWLGEALGNLVKNALDHTPASGTVSITWSKRPSLVEIIVADDGTGIDPADLYHIFKRFYRSPKSRDIRGVGLGLPLAKSIVEAGGGSLSVESEPGRGSRFVASFPILTKV